MIHSIFDDFDELMMALPTGDDLKVWKHFISIKTDLDFDDNTTSSEKDYLDHLNRNLSNAISEKSSYAIGPKLRSLRSSIERRTTCQDGYATQG